MDIVGWVIIFLRYLANDLVHIEFEKLQIRVISNVIAKEMMDSNIKEGGT